MLKQRGVLRWRGQSWSGVDVDGRIHVVPTEQVLDPAPEVGP